MIVNIIIAIVFYILGVSTKPIILKLRELKKAMEVYENYKYLEQEEKEELKKLEKIRKENEKLRID